MKKEVDNWPDFWTGEIVLEKKHWRKNMENFIKAVEPLLDFSPDDIILDIGCGSGLMAEFLKDKVKEIHGVDISENQIQTCREKFNYEKNLFFYELDGKNYTSLSCLKDKKFSIIIVLSVIQYYNNPGEVEELIREVRRVVLPGAKMLIADIPVKKGIVSDAWNLVKTAFREKNFFEPIKFLLTALRSSSYQKLLSSIGLMIMPESKLNELIDKLDLNAEVLSTPLTDKGNRRHLLIRF
jgi:ubiquinone/menaquinone biosynthesis C-methylase UbiE